MKRQLLFLTALAALIFYASCKTEEQVDMRLRLQPGAKYRYSIDMKTQSAMGPMSSTNEMLMESIYDVKAREGDQMRIEVVYDRIMMKMNSAMYAMGYDSKEPGQGDSLLRNLGDMLHKPFTMVVSEKGKISRIEGLEGIINALGDTSTEEGMMKRNMMAASFNDSAIRSNMQQALDIFPDSPVQVGDKWRKVHTMVVSMLAMTVDNEFTLKSVSNGVARLDVSAKITGKGSMPGDEMESMQIDINGTQTGTMEVQLETGLMTNGNLKQEIKGDMNMGGMKIPLNINQELHISAKKI